MAKLISQPSEMGRQPGADVRANSGSLMARQRPSMEQIRRVVSKKPSSFTMLPHETEDIQITGGTRSLVRRLLALNLPGSLRRGIQSEPNVQHSKTA